MYKIFLILIGILIISSQSQFASAAHDYQPCSAVELAPDADAYNDLVCAGVTDMAEERYAASIQQFEKALNIPLHEWPNFLLFPRLAEAYWRAGKVDQAQQALEKAKLSLEVYTGILRCVETYEGFELQDSSGALVAGAVARLIAMRMCGAAYDLIYSQRSLETISEEAALVARYLAIRQQIFEGRASHQH